MNEAGLRSAKPSFPKRFYAKAAVRAGNGGFEVVLDDRPARTPGRNPLVLPTKPLAEAIALEWNSIETTIDPRSMPLTRLANSALDGVSRMPTEVLAEVARFAGSDLLAYRAAEPNDLVRSQRAAWDPLIEWAREDLGAPLTVVEGVVHVAQPASTLDRVAAHLAALAGHGAAVPLRIAALHAMTTLTGSALLAAAVAFGRMTAEEAWAAAHVDEDHEIALWGVDDEASQRRASRWEEMRAAASVFALAAD